MGGSDDPSNIILLTIENHANAHRQLYEKYNKIEDYFAWKGLEGLLPKQEIILQLQRENGRRWGLANIGKNLSEKHKQKIREINLGKRQSEETRAKKQKSTSKPNNFADKIRQTRNYTSNYKKIVVAYGIKYRSIRAAANAVGYSHSSVRMFCLDNNNLDFYFFSQER